MPASKETMFKIRKVFDEEGQNFLTGEFIIQATGISRPTFYQAAKTPGLIKEDAKKIGVASRSQFVYRIEPGAFNSEQYATYLKTGMIVGPAYHKRDYIYPDTATFPDVAKLATAAVTAESKADMNDFIASMESEHLHPMFRKYFNEPMSREEIQEAIIHHIHIISKLYELGVNTK